MANHPRTDKVRQEQPCPRCNGSGLWSEDKPASANDRQEGADHYRKVPGEQHWDRLVRLYGLDVAFVYFVGNITAYVERYRDKNGIEDLKKARHYIDKLIELEEAHRMKNSPLCPKCGFMACGCKLDLPTVANAKRCSKCDGVGVVEDEKQNRVLCPSCSPKYVGED